MRFGAGRRRCAAGAGRVGGLWRRRVGPGAAWPFDAQQFMILDAATGGDRGGAVDDTILPVAMEVEHVRVYQARR